jgi:hypothetical protein
MLLNSTVANREYANRPADECFPSVAALVSDAIHQQLNSREVTYNAKDLAAVVDDGGLGLQSPKGTVARFSHWAFGQLARSVGAPAAYLRELPADLAAQCINFGLHETPHATDLQLLLQAPNGRPEPTVRAVTTEKYSRLWDGDLYGAVDKYFIQRDPSWALPPTWSGEPRGAYRGDRDSFLILANGGSIVTDPTAGANGQMYRGLLVKNSEVGGSSVYIEQILYRAICGNHLLMGALLHRGFRRRHVGTAHATLRDTIRAVAQAAHEWTQRSTAADDALIRSLIDHQIAATRAGVIDELKAIGFTAADAAGAYDRCEQTESASPRSAWGILQGATRLSQDTGYQGDRLALDILASKVAARAARVAV